MAPDVASIDAAFVVNFLKDNWDELLLLIFTIFQCIWCFVWLSKREFYIFFTDAPVYFPTLLLLVASLFFNTTWNLLSGFVVGASLVSVVSTLCYGDGNEYDKKAILNGLFTVWVSLSLILG